MSTEGGMSNLRQRSKELAHGPNAHPWRLLAGVYGRWWITIAIFLGLFALFDFGLGWNAYRAMPWAYFLAMAVLIASLSTPRRLSVRAAAGRASATALVGAWWPYLAAVVLFVGLLLILTLAGSQTVARSILISAYLAAGLLGIALAAQASSEYRYLLRADDVSDSGLGGR
jgi:hypothetical protein